jgi:Holliday junction resolvase-like predicted endonuclease
MSKSFKTNLNPSDKTFVELKNGNYPWWANLKKNKNISIQIRKGNTIDVYYNGGAILKDLRYDDAAKTFTADIHPKYIPLADESHYNSLELSSGGVKFTGKIDAMELAQFEDAKLTAIMNRVKKHFGSESEKAIQYSFATNDQYIIDTEFQEKNMKGRIDLVRLDASVKKIVFIEVKTITDPRLFADSGTGKENIHDQLKKYHDFAEEYQTSILDYYKLVLQIKKDLGIAGTDVMKLDISNWQVESKPLLIFGDCFQSWIDVNTNYIDKEIKGVAYGAYYFGKPEYNLDLIAKSVKNRHIFK